jgi:hypothetical protein
VEHRSNQRNVAIALVLGAAIVLLLGAAFFVVRRESDAIRNQSQVAAPSTVAAVAPRLTPTPVPTSAPPTATRVPATATPHPAAATATPRAATTARPAPGIEADTANVVVTYYRVNGTLVPVRPGEPTPVAVWYQQRGDAPEAQRAALLAGYQHFWDVRAQSLLKLDGTMLAQVMAGDPLRDDLAVMQQWRETHQAQLVNVDHNIEVLWATADDGAVLDGMNDRSTMISTDPTPTPAPDAEPPPEPTPVPGQFYRMAFLLKRNGGVWQVVDSVQIVR